MGQPSASPRPAASVRRGTFKIIRHRSRGAGNLLRSAGIPTFRQLAGNLPNDSQHYHRIELHITDRSTWPEQSRYHATAGVRQRTLRTYSRCWHSRRPCRCSERPASGSRWGRQRVQWLIAINIAAAKASFTVSGRNRGSGISPKIADHLHCCGHQLLAALSHDAGYLSGPFSTPPDRRSRIANRTWPEQSALAAHDQWRAEA